MFPSKPVAILAPTGSKQHQLLPTTRWFTGRFAYNHIHVSPGSCFLPSIVEPSTTKCDIVTIHSVSSTQAHGKMQAIEWLALESPDGAHGLAGKRLVAAGRTAVLDLFTVPQPRSSGVHCILDPSSQSIHSIIQSLLRAFGFGPEKCADAKSLQCSRMGLSLSGCLSALAKPSTRFSTRCQGMRNHSWPLHRLDKVV